MLKYLSEASLAGLRGLGHGAPGGAEAIVPQYPTHAGPTFRLVEDALAPIDEMLRRIDEPTGGKRPPSVWLRDYVYRGAGRDTQSKLATLNGRRCCLKLARRLEPELAHLQLPFERTCPECGARWSVELRIREAQRGHDGR